MMKSLGIFALLRVAFFLLFDATARNEPLSLRSAEISPLPTAKKRVLVSFLNLVHSHYRFLQTLRDFSERSMNAFCTHDDSRQRDTRNESKCWVVETSREHWTELLNTCQSVHKKIHTAQSYATLSKFQNRQAAARPESRCSLIRRCIYIYIFVCDLVRLFYVYQTETFMHANIFMMMMWISS